MRLVFGQYSFKIKTYNPEDFGIKNEQKSNFEIEVRQKCFHVFWIPCFSIGKIYALRKDGKLFNLPQEYIPKIKSKDKLKTPWYSFSLPIIITLYLIIFVLNNQYQSYKHYQSKKENYEFELNQIDNELNNLTTFHYIKIRDFDNWNNTEGLYLKVEQINDSLLKLFLIKTNLKDFNALPFIIKDFYLRNKHNLDTINLPISNLKKSICRDYKIFNEKSKYGFSLLNDRSKYVIESIDYFKGPVIKAPVVIDSGSGSMDCLILQNFGSPVELIEIKNIENKINWNNSLPQYIPTDSSLFRYFCLSGDNFKRDTKYKFELVFKDSLSNEYKYIMGIKNSERKLERVIE